MSNSSQPTRALPPLLYGTAWKKDETARLVQQALHAGFRGIDTACQPKHYNEPGVGQGIAAFLRDGNATRAELYIQTKFTSLDGQDPKRIPYDAKLPLREQVLQSCAVSRRNLGVDVLDCLVLHSPLRTLEQTLVVWSAFEELVAQGVVHTLGISNCYKLPTLRAVWERATIKPSVVQNRFYSETGYDVAVRQYCQQVGVVYQSFWTLTANPHLLSDDAVIQTAKRVGWTPAQVLLRCLVHVGVVPLVGTTSAVHMAQDLVIMSGELSASEIQRIVALLR